MLSRFPSTLDMPAPPLALQQVAALTARMLAASNADEWTLVSDLEAQRFALLSALPPVVGSETATVEVILREVLVSTRQITDRIRHTQTAEQNALGVIRKGRQAAVSYLENIDTSGLAR